MTDPVMLFHEALQDTFGALDWLPIPNSKIQRFHVPGDRIGSRNGWYVLFLDGIASGVFGSWKIGGSQVWSSRKPANRLEVLLITRRIEQARLQREAEERESQQRTATRAAHLWRTATPADPAHPYLIRKGCQPHGLRQLGEVLLVPLFVSRQLVNLQRIYPNGTKRFLRDGRVKDAYSAIRVPGARLKEGSRLYVCEGWATGATIHEVTGSTVACAMNANNLYAVADYLHQTYPYTEIIIAGDDDRQTKGNPGRTAAEAAAQMLGCSVMFPSWSGTEPLALTDFNDLRQWLGANQ